MTIVFYIFAAVVGLLTHYVSMVIWSRRETRLRLYALLLFFAAVPGLGFGAIESLGWPKDIRWAWRVNGDAMVLGYKLEYGEKIYIFVDLLDGKEPRSFVVPWSDSAAQAIQDSMETAKLEGQSGILMRFRWGHDYQSPRFWSLPPDPTPPPKDPINAPMILERGDTP